MSFVCAMCRKPQVAGTSPTKIVTEIREVVYQAVTYDRTGKIVPKVEKPKSVGRETVEERDVCPKCAAFLGKTGAKPKVVGMKTIEYFHKKQDGPGFRRKDGDED